MFKPNFAGRKIRAVNLIMPFSSFLGNANGNPHDRCRCRLVCFDVKESLLCGFPLGLIKDLPLFVWLEAGKCGGIVVSLWKGTGMNCHFRVLQLSRIMSMY